jgi:hypothetical protein
VPVWTEDRQRATHGFVLVQTDERGCDHWHKQGYHDLAHGAGGKFCYLVKKAKQEPDHYTVVRDAVLVRSTLVGHVMEVLGDAVGLEWMNTADLNGDRGGDFLTLAYQYEWESE